MLRRQYRRRIKPAATRLGLHAHIRAAYRRASPGYYVGFHTREALRGIADEYYPFATAETVTIDPIPAPERTPLQGVSESLAGTYTFDQPFVAVVNNARIVPQMGVAVTPDNTIILETANSRTSRIRGFLQSHPRYALDLLATQHGSPSPPESPDIDTAVSFIRTPDAAGERKTEFSHWLQGYLTRLEGLAHYVAETGRRPSIIVEENPAPWMIESLEFFGFGDDIVHWHPDEELHIECLVVPSVRRIEQVSPYQGVETKITSPRAAQWLREQARKQTAITDKFSSRVFVSRGDAMRRELANRDEILDILRPRGYEEYELAKMPVKEQIALFMQADSVVGVHGAGLAHILFTEACTLTEIIGRPYKPTYYLLAQCVGVDYQLIAGEPIDNPNRPRIHRDVWVDPDELLAALS